MPATRRKSTSDADEVDNDVSSSTTSTDTPATKSKSPKKEAKRTKSSSSGSKTSSPKKRVKKEVQCLTEATHMERLYKGKEENKFTIISWNVAGIRAMLKKTPELLPDFVNKYKPDVLCLQETKLQDKHLNDPKLGNISSTVLKEQGYVSYWTCANGKGRSLGYAGTAVFLKEGLQPPTNAEPKKKGSLDAFVTKKQNENKTSSLSNKNENPRAACAIEFGINNPKHDNEGRSITVHFPAFSMTALYVPNSGQKLERLDYRTKEWDVDLLQFMQTIEKSRNVPVMWLGDLNVAHKALDVYNDGAPHLKKQAGTTVEEQDSFTNQLDNGFVDVFRELHPKAQAHYTYWSQRANNRPGNKGLRLDYFVCSQKMMSDTDAFSKVVVRDSYMIPQQVGSDHAPIVLELELLD